MWSPQINLFNLFGWYFFPVGLIFNIFFSLWIRCFPTWYFWRECWINKIKESLNGLGWKDLRAEGDGGGRVAGWDLKKKKKKDISKLPEGTKPPQFKLLNTLKVKKLDFNQQEFGITQGFPTYGNCSWEMNINNWNLGSGDSKFER